MGIIPDALRHQKLNKPTIWLHAVSVGEVVALNPMVHEIRKALPHSSIIISTGTETGQMRARQLISSADGFLYLPIDLPECINPVVKAINPDVFVLLETELWPNLIYKLKDIGARIILANGRISDRSFPRYKKLKFLFARILKNIDYFLMSSDEDAKRIEQMGASSNRIVVTGNTKYDSVTGAIDKEVESEIRSIYNIAPDEHVFVAGSVHPGEFEIILDVYLQLAEQFPKLLLIIVPRHVKRTSEILNEIEKRGLNQPRLRSGFTHGESRRENKIIVVDITGELFKLYSMATVVFIGGSLVPKGGQNIVEPAAWGNMVLFGPHMEDFRDAKKLLMHAGSGIEVKSAQELFERSREIISQPEKYDHLRLKSQQAVLSQIGSARRNSGYIVQLATRVT